MGELSLQRHLQALTRSRCDGHRYLNDSPDVLADLSRSLARPYHFRASRPRHLSARSHFCPIATANASATVPTIPDVRARGGTVSVIGRGRGCACDDVPMTDGGGGARILLLLYLHLGWLVMMMKTGAVCLEGQPWCTARDVLHF